MIKIALNNFNLVKALSQIPILRHIFIYRLMVLESATDPALYAEIVSSFRTDTILSKTTAGQRFSSINPYAIKYIRTFSNLSIHDVAVSSGITSCDLLRDLEAAGISSRFHISDKFCTYYYSGNSITRIFGAEKNFVSAYLFSIVADRHVSKFFFLSKFLWWLMKPSSKFPEHPKKIVLFDPETKNNIAKGSMIHIDFDVFSNSIKGQFDFVRCMNLLNLKSCFSAEQIKAAISNIRDSLKENGILLVGRTDNTGGLSRISFYRREQDKLTLLEAVNGGTELHSIVSSIGAQL